MSEMDKLEQYLEEHKYHYQRFDDYTGVLDWHQIVVYRSKRAEKEHRKDWDVVCHYGSFGYKEGLLEAMGSIVDPDKDGDTVAGWLTAEDVIARLENANKQ